MALVLGKALRFCLSVKDVTMERQIERWYRYRNVIYFVLLDELLSGGRGAQLVFHKVLCFCAVSKIVPHIEERLSAHGDVGA